MLPSSRWALRLSRVSRKQLIRAASSSRPPKSHSLDVRPKEYRTVTSRTPPRDPRSNTPDQTGQPEQPEVSQEASKATAIRNVLQQTSHSEENSLLSPVHIPKDPHGILDAMHPATSILANSSIIIRRQLEMLNVFLGYEQANKYVIMDPEGNTIGYLAEQDHGLGSTMKRQAFKTHRSFTTHVFDKNEREILRFHRPFAWINSHIRIYDAVNRDPNAASEPSTALYGTSVSSATNESDAQISTLPMEEMRVIGAAQQQWTPLRRKYNLFLLRDKDYLDMSNPIPQLTPDGIPLNTTAVQTVDQKEANTEMFQWAHCDEPFLSWDFSLRAEDGRLIGSVNRSFGGFAREIFTDTGAYALRMDAASLAEEPRHLISQTGEDAMASDTPPNSGMTLDQRAIMLATAVSIDFDYFSRHSGAVGGGGFMPLWFPWWGGGAAEAGAEAGVAGEAAGAVGGAARGAGAGAAEGGIVGASTMAGYEAMQRSQSGGAAPVDDASPQASVQDSPPSEQSQSQEDVWGWSDHNQQQGGSSGGSGGSNDGGGGGGGGDGGGDWWSDFF